jgi:hypothetical protein
LSFGSSAFIAPIQIYANTCHCAKAQREHKPNVPLFHRRVAPFYAGIDTRNNLYTQDRRFNVSMPYIFYHNMIVSVRCGRSAEDCGMLLRSILRVTPRHEFIKTSDLVVCDATEDIRPPTAPKFQRTLFQLRVCAHPAYTLPADLGR